MKKSIDKKINKIIMLYPEEFVTTPNDKLLCIPCNKIVDFKKLFFVESHRKSKNHQTKTQNIENRKIMQPTFLNNCTKSCEFDNLLLKSFLSSYIPLKKLRNKHIMNLFNFMGFKLQSETKLRSNIDPLFDSEMNMLKEKIKDKNVFFDCR